ncbi:MAG: sn-glycerol-1-phosphate dehydrogenase [Anaerolineae bacterium]|nr:sn-glycerol-1-phosphate dehydrogenase [Anaerolineae bacterium]
MQTDIPITIGEETIPELTRYCREKNLDRFLLVSDENTHAVLGARVEAALKAQDWDVRTVVLGGEEVIADEETIVQVLLAAGREKWTYVAVGSGTITDITRFCSHRTRNDFISLPTAPSVDGYTSIGAPLVVRRVKMTASAQPPVAVFADLPTLCDAPREMIAAGFGDMLGKFTSLADWRLGALLWDEPYDASIARRYRGTLLKCVDEAAEIKRASPAGITALIAALVESGLFMLEFGQTRPASGSEHHMSHYWEMKLLQENRPALLHGAKVGLGTILAAGRYDVVRRLEREEIARRLTNVRLPDREAEMARIRQVYGPLTDEVIATQRPFLEMTAADFEALKRRIIDKWDEVLEIAATVPPAQEIIRLLEQVGGPTTPQQLGLSAEETQAALDHAHYLRDRFTVAKLGHLMGLW